MRSELEKGYGRKWLWPNLIYCTEFAWRDRKIMKNLSQDSWSLDQDLNMDLPDMKREC
jgi:hypothetical protein